MRQPPPVAVLLLAACAPSLVAQTPEAPRFTIRPAAGDIDVDGRLFSYKLNPQTVAFLGYSDTRLGTEIVDLTQQGRTFFIKVGYALRP